MMTTYSTTDQGVAVGSANHFHTLTSPVPSPVKNKPAGPICMDRTSSFEYNFPLSEKLNQWLSKVIYKHTV